MVLNSVHLPAPPSITLRLKISSFDWRPPHLKDRAMLTLSLDTTLPLQPYLIAYGSSLLSMLALDAAWLTMVMGPLYKSHLGDMMLAQPKIAPAAVFYLLYAMGVVVFAVTPALGQQSWTCALMLSGLLGLIAYATYDLTNLSTLKGWSLTLSLIDIGWGTLMTSIGGTVAYFVVNRTS
ncbi:DUF2177 family protein [Undibacterium sp. Ji42W]|uniref:DUF2177 family protein n=1 Tax=Undibacterium sp. Ji42W TaxID=3413039 RepID=UPI003BF082E5